MEIETSISTPGARFPNIRRLFSPHYPSRSYQTVITQHLQCEQAIFQRTAGIDSEIDQRGRAVIQNDEVRLLARFKITDMILHVEKELSATITHTGDIYYSGDPYSVSSDITGSGRLIKTQ